MALGGLALEASSQIVLFDLAGSAPNQLLGNVVSGVGDVDGDGHDDFGVGAPGVGSSNQGQIHLHSGATGGILYTWDGTTPGQALNGIFPAGDVNGDGLGDLIIHRDVVAAPNWTMLFTAYGGPPKWFQAGGDVDGDGFDDLLLGDQGISSGGFFQNGLGEVLSGPSGAVLYTYAGTGNFDFLGVNAAIGDINGDGCDDFAFTAHETSATSTSGAGYVIVSSGCTGTPLFYLDGNTYWPAPGFGGGAAGAGDVNADGIPDLLVGAPAGGFWGSFYFGKVFVLSMADGSVLHAIDGPPIPFACYACGGGLSSVGDVDGDGFDDFLVAARLAAMTFLYSGATGQVLYEPPQGPSWSTGGAGDVNADGFPDFIEGWPQYSPTPSTPYLGRAFVYSGAPPGVTSSGQGCPGTSGVTPRIGATGTPALGSSFAINLSKAPVATPAALLLGFSNTTWWGIPLPLNLAPFGMPACDLRVSPDLLFFATTAGNLPDRAYVTMTFGIPSIPSLAGMTVHAQWYVLDSAPALFPGSLTRALQIVLQ